MRIKRIKKYLVRIIGSLLAAAVVLGLLQRLLVPKYAEGVTEGAFIGEYYKAEDKRFDVIFLGDCEVYDCYDTIELWEEYGINSYIRGSAMQSIWQSYYLLEDTLKYHKPEVVIFNVASLQYDAPVSEAYNRMTLDGMRWSVSKYKAVMESMTEDEHLIEYVFPLLRYHSRWDELGIDDLKYFFSTPKVTYNGYHAVDEAVPAGDIPEGIPLYDHSFGKKAWEYMDRIRLLCEENDITLILVKAPILYPVWYDEYEAQVEDYAKENSLMYINLSEENDSIGIDYRKDTYDGGMHINLSGADKISHYMGGILVEMGITDRRGDPVLDEIWMRQKEAFSKR